MPAADSVLAVAVVPQVRETATTKARIRAPGPVISNFVSDAIGDATGVLPGHHFVAPSQRLTGV